MVEGIKQAVELRETGVLSCLKPEVNILIQACFVSPKPSYFAAQTKPNCGNVTWKSWRGSRFLHAKNNERATDVKWHMKSLKRMKWQSTCLHSETPSCDITSSYGISLIPACFQRTCTILTGRNLALTVATKAYFKHDGGLEDGVLWIYCFIQQLIWL